MSYFEQSTGKRLTHWGRVTHICVSNITIIVPDNGLSPDRRQAIIWTNTGMLLIRTLGTNFSEILSEIHIFSFKKMHLKMSSAKWRPFCHGLNVLMAPRGVLVLLFQSAAAAAEGVFKNMSAHQSPSDGPSGKFKLTLQARLDCLLHSRLVICHITGRLWYNKTALEQTLQNDHDWFFFFFSFTDKPAIPKFNNVYQIWVNSSGSMSTRGISWVPSISGAKPFFVQSAHHLNWRRWAQPKFVWTFLVIYRIM